MRNQLYQDTLPAQTWLLGDFNARTSPLGQVLEWQLVQRLGKKLVLLLLQLLQKLVLGQLLSWR